MNKDELFNVLNDRDTLDGHRQRLRQHLLDELARYEREPEKGEEIAYGLAGLMATQAVMSLPNNDPFDVVLSMAGELELPPGQRQKGTTWDEMATLIRALPDTP